MQPILFDTSVYIHDLRAKGDRVLSARFLQAGVPVWLSAVVLEELLAGASERERRPVERLERDFQRLGRIVIPTLDDCTKAGKMLSEFGSKFGYEAIGRGRLTNDTLIAISSRRLGITVVTANPRDFERLARIRSFSWQMAGVQ
ncbi:MAG: PIN domain-containing protein [Acidobacteriia bacterium]|nr:PIN domain-containing protein [Terriglobia bacterium]